MEKAAKPKVSVIMPSLNVAQYIKECMDSVVNQTLKDIEIICVDAGSTDGTLEILKEYVENDERIRIINSDKKSYGYQMNLGIASANGEYVGIVETDDYIDLDMYDALSKIADELKLDIIKADCRKFVGDDLRQEVEYTKVTLPNLYNKVLDPKKEVNCLLFSLTCAGIYNLDFLRKNNIRYNETPGASYQDNGFYFQTHCCADRMYFLDKPFYWYRQDNPNSSMNNREKVFLICDEYKFIYDFLSCNPDLYKLFVKRYCRGVFYAYRSAYERIAEEYKLSFLQRWSDDLNALKERGEFFPDVWSKAERNIVEEIMQNPEEYYFKTRSALYLKNSFDILNSNKSLNFNYVDDSDLTPPDGFQCVIPIVFASNDKYSIYAGVAIQSILENADPGKYYRIYILHDELSYFHIESLEMIKSHQALVKCIDVSELLNSKKASFYECEHFTKEMYYRFVIAEVFSCYDKVVYLDCDLIVNTDIADIIPNDMGDKLICAIRNCALAPRVKQLKHFFNIDADDYINSGVLVINVAAWLEENIVEKCFNCLRKIPKERLLYPDQDILNIVCQNRIYYLDEAWNFYWHMVYGSSDFVNLTKPIQDRVGNNFKILHFASGLKPWFLPHYPLAKYFWKYARMSHFYEEILLSNIINDNLQINKKNNLKTNKSSVQNMVGDDMLKRKIQQLEIQLQNSNNEINNIRSSKSFRIGRFFTYIPRKVRGGIRCYQEHGMGYTLGRIKEKYKELFHKKA